MQPNKRGSNIQGTAATTGLSSQDSSQKFRSIARRLAKTFLLMFAAWRSTAGLVQGESMPALPRNGTNGMSPRAHTANITNQIIPLGSFEVMAFGQPLLWDSPACCLGKTNGPGQVAVLGSASTNAWEYLWIDLSAAAAPEYARWHRHLLYVAPDLFAILDEADLAGPGAPQVQLCSPGMLMLEPRSQDFRLEMKDAGLTAHVFNPMPKVFRSWQSNSFGGGTRFTAPATNAVKHLRLLTLVIPHAAGQRNGTGFKLLESETAIGARIWRNGLPTLIAFRTAPPGAESSLASMPVNGPVAVDVFEPNPARRKKAGNAARQEGH